MKFILVVDDRGFGPFYEKFVTAVKRAIADGGLRRGERFPSVRTIAKQMKKNPNTIAKCVGILLQEGILRRDSNQGTYVAPFPPTVGKMTGQPLFRLIDHLLVEAAYLGADEEFVRKLILERAQRMRLVSTTQTSAD